MALVANEVWAVACWVLWELCGRSVRLRWCGGDGERGSREGVHRAGRLDRAKELKRMARECEDGGEHAEEVGRGRKRRRADVYRASGQRQSLSAGSFGATLIS